MCSQDEIPKVDFGARFELLEVANTLFRGSVTVNQRSFRALFGSPQRAGFQEAQRIRVPKGPFERIKPPKALLQPCCSGKRKLGTGPARLLTLPTSIPIQAEPAPTRPDRICAPNPRKATPSHPSKRSKMGSSSARAVLLLSVVAACVSSCTAFTLPMLAAPVRGAFLGSNAHLASRCLRPGLAHKSLHRPAPALALSASPASIAGAFDRNFAKSVADQACPTQHRPRDERQSSDSSLNSPFSLFSHLLCIRR